MKVKALPIVFGLTVAAGLAVSVSLSSCGKGDTGIFPEPYFTSELIRDYVKTKAEFEKPLPEEYSAFLDFSDGVNCAYDDAGNKEILRTILNSLSGNPVAYYSLANNIVTPIEGTPEDIFKKATDPKEYKNQAAPIRSALEQIVKEGKPAVLITDYEEYDGKVIHKGAYAKRFFVDWLRAENSISFICVDYKEGRKDKKLFFTIFDGKKNVLRSAILDALKGKFDKDKLFVMSNSYYRFETRYPAANRGGNYHYGTGFDKVDNVSCVVEDITNEDHYVNMPQYKAEYYPMSSTWSDFVINAINTQDETKPFPPHSYTYFLQNLYFDFSEFAYDDVELDVRVSNAQEDYTRFFNAKYAELMLEQDKASGKAVEGDPTNPYYDEHLRVRPEHQYVPVPMTPVKDLFKGEDEPSEKYPEPIKVEGFEEFGVDIDWANFDGTQINGAGLSDLIRIDIVIKKVDDRDCDDIEDLFKWGDYDNLSESVRLALQEARPKDTVVYTYYVHAY